MMCFMYQLSPDTEAIYICPLLAFGGMTSTVCLLPSFEHSVVVGA